MKACKAALAAFLAVLLCASPAMAESDVAADQENTAPVAENQQIETYRGVSVGGQLTARDAEGDELTFELTTAPMKGSVELAPDGAFVYTPREDRRGKDYFGFRAVDTDGNASQEGTVIIRLKKQTSAVHYADMDGHGAAYASVILTEQGVFTGKTVGGEYVFEPDSPVSRGEFLSMCMSAAGCELLGSVRATGFADDDEIGAWLKPYVATALFDGYIRGSAAEVGAQFRPADDITLREACMMLNAVLGVTDVVSVGSYFTEPESEGAQAVANLTAAHVMLPRWEDLDAAITRADAATLLQNAMALLARR